MHRILSIVRNMAGLARRNIEAARLQDENVTLSNEVHRLSSTVNAHQRFNERAKANYSKASMDRQATLDKLKELNEQVKSLETTVKAERANRVREERSLGEVKKLQEVKIRAMESALRDSENRFTEELQAIRMDHETEYQQLTSRETPETTALRHKVLNLEKELGTCRHLLDQRESRLQQTRERLDESMNSLESYRAKYESQQSATDNAWREIKIKDKQLKALREDLNDARLQVNEASGRGKTQDSGDEDDAIEFMKEEMAVMKASFEKQVQDLKISVHDLESQLRRRS